MGTYILRSAWTILLLGFILGHGVVAVVQAYKFFRIRAAEVATYRFFGVLFLSIGLTPALLAIAIAELPPPMPTSARWMFLTSLVVLALGTWPTVFYLEGKRRETESVKNAGDQPKEFWQKEFQSIRDGQENFRAVLREELDAAHERHNKGCS